MECTTQRTILLKESAFTHLISYILKNVARTCQMFLPEFIVLKDKMGLNILIKVTGHCAPTLTACNGTSCACLGLSADQYLLF
jgi:hypothetical protein